jgi:hypothetical protein
VAEDLEGHEILAEQTNQPFAGDQRASSLSTGRRWHRSTTRRGGLYQRTGFQVIVLVEVVSRIRW